MNGKRKPGQLQQTQGLKLDAGILWEIESPPKKVVRDRKKASKRTLFHCTTRALSCPIGRTPYIGVLIGRSPYAGVFRLDGPPMPEFSDWAVPLCRSFDWAVPLCRGLLWKWQELEVV